MGGHVTRNTRSKPFGSGMLLEGMQRMTGVLGRADHIEKAGIKMRRRWVSFVVVLTVSPPLTGCQSPSNPKAVTVVGSSTTAEPITTASQPTTTLTIAMTATTTTTTKVALTTTTAPATTTTELARLTMIEAAQLYLDRVTKDNAGQVAIRDRFDSDGDGLVQGKADLILFCQALQDLERASVDFYTATRWPVEAQPLINRLTVENATVTASYDTAGGKQPCVVDNDAGKRRFQIGTEIRILFGLPINR
jgi:hypothetical protein